MNCYCRNVDSCFRVDDFFIQLEDISIKQSPIRYQRQLDTLPVSRPCAHAPRDVRCLPQGTTMLSVRCKFTFIASMRLVDRLTRNRLCTLAKDRIITRIKSSQQQKCEACHPGLLQLLLTAMPRCSMCEIFITIFINVGIMS